MEIHRVGPRQVRMIEALADQADTPGHAGALILIDSGADGWAIWVDVTRQITTIYGEGSDFGALVRGLRSIAGPNRRAASRLADRIESEMVTAIWLIGHFSPDLALALLRDFRGEAS